MPKTCTNKQLTCCDEYVWAVAALLEKPLAEYALPVGRKWY